MTNYTNGAASTVVTGTLAALNATVDGTTDLSNFASVRLQITGTFVGTATFQVSDDGTNWVSRSLMGSTAAATVTTTTAAGVFFGPIGAKFFRVTASAYTSGSIVVTVVYSAVSESVATHAIINSNLTTRAQSGSLTSTAITASSTNATLVKNSGAQLYSLDVTNASAAVIYLKMYNKASAPTVGTDTPVAIYDIPANSARVVTYGAHGRWLGNGLAYAITGAIGDLDGTAIGTGGGRIGFDYI